MEESRIGVETIPQSSSYSNRRFGSFFFGGGLAPLAALLPFLAFLLVVNRGIDFGVHWDEPGNIIAPVALSFQHGFTLLPEDYSYPGVVYWLPLAGLTPEVTRAIVSGKRTPDSLKDELLPVLKGQAFLLRLRRIFAFVTALTVLWIYFAVLVWGRSWREAMCAAFFFAFSWEVVYHARWAAPDGILMQFGALAFLLLSLAWRTDSRWPLFLAAVAAGFGCGSKYPGALLVLSLIHI